MQTNIAAAPARLARNQSGTGFDWAITQGDKFETRYRDTKPLFLLRCSWQSGA